MLPPPPRSRFAALPRLGLPSASSGSVERSHVEEKAEADPPTAYTSVFQSPGKSGVVSAPLAADTPSRLARFREANWAAKETKKRPRGADSETDILPPKPRIVMRLFADDPPSGAAGGSQEDAEEASTAREVKAATTIPSSLNEQDEPVELEKETQVALGLHENLVRDSARLKLTMDSLKDEIDYYFDVLARIEQVAASAHAAADRKDGADGISDESAASVRALADGLQRIISAAKPTAPVGVSALPGSGSAKDPQATNAIE